jgi:hypothetical protein
MAYDRKNAILSAMGLWDRVSHDGYVAIGGPAGKRSGPPKVINGVTLAPGLPFSEIGTIDQEDDCAHFVSCCLGRTRCKVTVFGNDFEVLGGGLDIPSPFRPVYGQTHAGRLAGALVSKGARIIQPQFMVKEYESTRKAILQHLMGGDVLCYASHDNHDSYEHSAILLGSTQIACHTKSRIYADYTAVYHPWVTLLKLP